jgi:hypothetical protein
MARALSIDALANLADAFDGVVWSIKHAACMRRLSSDSQLERRVPGWVQVRRDPRRDGELLIARVWLYGIALWEFRFKFPGWRLDNEIVGADIVFLGQAFTPMLVRTRVGTIIPLSPPRLIEET